MGPPSLTEMSLCGVWL